MSDTEILMGSCLCGAVKYQVKQAPSEFYFCHCQQCQKVTGSSFAANIIGRPKDIEWLSGEDVLTHFAHPSRAFSKTFCSRCGSGLPHVNKSGTSLVIPAGSLDRETALIPQANIFMSEQASWLANGLKATSFKAFPE